MIVDLDQQCWSHVFAALRSHVVWCREVSVPVPADVLALFALADTRRQGPTTVADQVCALDGGRMPKMLVTYAEAAIALAMSKRTIERLVARGDLPVVDVGGTPRVRVADLEAYVEALTAKPRSFREQITTKESA